METVLENTEISDEQLAFEAAREASDGPAFLALLARYQDRIWRVCFRLMGNAEDANDATQEVLVRLFLNRAKFEGRSKYSTWAHGIAVRTCLMMRRGFGRRRRREEVVAKEGAGKYERSTSDVADTSLDLMQMLETLDDTDRAILILKYAEGYSHDELAEMFELSASACKMRISRARDKLKQRFPEHQFGQDEN